MTEPLKTYALGFMFYRSPLGELTVVLIKKKRPAWQAGLLNGIGGKVEDGETPEQAMVREFKEEAGLITMPEDWKHVLTMTLDNDAERERTGRAAKVEVFSYVFTKGRPPVASQTDEELRHVPAELALHFPHTPNLRWLLPLCIYADTKSPFTMEMAS
ncbi:MAG: NUDIX domain-containing protein [Rhodospirillaceae bacterium]